MRKRVRSESSRNARAVTVEPAITNVRSGRASRSVIRLVRLIPADELLTPRTTWRYTMT